MSGRAEEEGADDKAGAYRVGICAGYRQDLDILTALARKAGLEPVPTDARAAAPAEGFPAADMFVLTAEAFKPAIIDALAAELRAAPVWSAPPVILLAEAESEAVQKVCAELRAAKPGLQTLILIRPCAAVEIESALGVASEGRRRQLSVKTLLAEREEAEALSRFLLEELRHRVKNVFAMVSAIGIETVRNSPDDEAFEDAFRSRIACLSAAYDALSPNRGRGAALGALVEGTVTALLGEGLEDRVEAEGPAVMVPPQLASALGLVLHELGGNARKHGALSNDEGRVHLRWEEKDGAIRLFWREEGGPPVEPPSRRGFGTTVIERSVPRAKVSLDYAREGLRCAIELPAP